MADPGYQVRKIQGPRGEVVELLEFDRGPVTVHRLSESYVEHLKAEFVRGNLSLEEFEEKMAIAVLKDPVIDRPYRDAAGAWSGGAQEESLMVRKAGGVALAGVAALVAFTLIAFIAFGVAGLIVYLLSV